MPDSSRPQTFANHRRIPPAAYAVALVVLTAEVIRRVVELIQAPSVGAGWAVVVAAAVMVIGYYARRSAQVVQDRAIRDAMRQRLERLLPAARQGEIARFTLPQLVALRFAGDAELPVLAADVAAGTLVRADDIKRRITAWQADWLRV